MATPWDRAARAYLDEWVPRFAPYHLDLVQELALRAGERVFVTCAGPGAEVVAAARAVGSTGHVRATDASEAMVALCQDQVARGGFTWASCTRADAAVIDPREPYDAIVCAFGLWQLENRTDALRAWGERLAPSGKVGILTWGPPEAGDPYELFAEALGEVEPAHAVPEGRIAPERSAIAALFASSGLSMVRHTIVRHTMAFASARAFVLAAREGCIWRKVWSDLGDPSFERVAAAFYAKVGGADRPVSFEAPATLAIGARPGAEVVLAARPSVRVPPIEGGTGL